MQGAQCSSVQKRIPSYKCVARGLPAGAQETVARRRYVTHPGGVHRPCIPADGASRHTRCYSPKDHSNKRKHCQLLLDPDNPLHDFEPGLYLVGGKRFPLSQTLVCRFWKKEESRWFDVDTRTRSPKKATVVLGPFVHPETKLLTIKCILLNTLLVDDLQSFGDAFETDDVYEHGVVVPTIHMIKDFLQDLRQSASTLHIPAHIELKQAVKEVVRNLSRQEEIFNLLQQEMYFSTFNSFHSHVRLLCKCFYEMALYLRRYAGPGSKIPLHELTDVNSFSNKISHALKGKFVSSTRKGVRLTPHETGRSTRADVVTQPDGSLVHMYEAYAASIIMIFDTLHVREKVLVLNTFRPGTPYRKADGLGFYLTSIDEGVAGMSLFHICFGHPERGHFSSHSSVFGTETYDVQIAAIKILRCVQTIIPYVYTQHPTWARTDGEFIDYDDFG